MANQIKNLIGTGNSALSSQAISGFTATGLTATGSAQTDALQLSSDINEFTTVASSTGAKLPANSSPGDECVVANYGAQTLSVYGQTGESITNGSVNAAFSVAANKSAYFVKASSTRWNVVLSA